VYCFPNATSKRHSVRSPSLSVRATCAAVEGVSAEGVAKDVWVGRPRPGSEKAMFVMSSRELGRVLARL
jgi:hypothetical protein